MHQSSFSQWMFSFFLRHILCLVAFIGLLASSGAGAQEVLRLGGTGTGTLLLQRMATAYGQAHPGTRVEVVTPPLGSNGGLRALTAGSIQLAIVTIPTAFSPSSLRQGGLRHIPWVTTPLVFTGHDISRETRLTLSQVADIYAGRNSRWDGGKPIRLVSRSERESDTSILRAASPEMEVAVLQGLKRSGTPFAENDFDSQKLLEQAPGSFGTLALGQLLLSSSPLKPATLDGVAPSLESLRNGTYRLTKPLYLVIWQAPSRATLDFLAYLQSPEVLKMLEPYGFVPLPH